MADNAVLLKFDDASLRAWLTKMNASLRDLTPVLKRLYATMGFKDIIQHFKDESGPDGKWVKRAKSTQRHYAHVQAGLAEPAPGVARAAYSPTNKLLQMTGTLRKSILPTNTRTVNRTSILAFSNDPKSGKHDRGDSETRLPARPFMWLSNSAKQSIVDAAAKMVLNG